MVSDWEGLTFKITLLLFKDIVRSASDVNVDTREPDLLERAASWSGLVEWHIPQSGREWSASFIQS